MAQQMGLPIFMMGVGIGVAATLVFKDGDLRSRMGKALGNKLDDATDATKRIADQVAAKSKDAVHMAKDAANMAKDAAHMAGEQLERGGKRLQNT